MTSQTPQRLLSVVSGGVTALVLARIPTAAAIGQQFADAAGDAQKIQTIYNWLQTAVNFMSGLVGLVVVISIIYAGIQYSAAGNDPQKVAAAKQRIYNSIFALIAFLFIFVFIQWLIPGGVITP